MQFHICFPLDLGSLSLHVVEIEANRSFNLANCYISNFPLTQLRNVNPFVGCLHSLNTSIMTIFLQGGDKK